MAKKKLTQGEINRRRKQNKQFKQLIFLLAIGFGLYFMWERDPAGPNPYELDNLPPVSARPYQKKIAFPLPFEIHGFEILPVAKYYLTARVIATRKYDKDPFARVAPTDVVVTWGRMADQRLANSIQITPINRFYNMQRADGLENVIDPREMRASMANMHLIPYNPNVQSYIDTLKPGNQVTLIGYLVNAKKNSTHLKTSITREDGGPAGSEVMLVQRIVIH